MQYLSARDIYHKRKDPAPPQTYGGTMDGWFKILYGEDLDTYIERVTKEIKEKNLK